VAAWRQGSLEVVLSRYILDELRRVLPKLAHRHGLAPNDIDDLIDALAIQAELVEPEAMDEPELPDVNDQPVLGTLIAALHGGQDVPQGIAVPWLQQRGIASRSAVARAVGWMLWRRIRSISRSRSLSGPA
jgi:hypothetical protein